MEKIFFMKLYERQRTPRLVKQLHELFEHKKFLWVSDLKLKGSHLTILSARRALGIRSEKIGKRWRWHRPTIPLDAALKSFGRSGAMYRVGRTYGQEKDEQLPNYISALTDVMKSCHYVCSRPQAIADMRAYMLKRTAFTYAAKKQLKIKTYKYKDEFLWVMPDESVVEAIQTAIGDRPVPREELVSKFHPALLEVIATDRRNSIHRWYHDHRMYFYDFNQWTPPLTKQV